MPEQVQIVQDAKLVQLVRLSWGVGAHIIAKSVRNDFN